MKALVANHTHIRFLSGMVPHNVSLQAARIVVPLVAVGTNKWSFACVDSCVHFQCSARCKRFSTDGAEVRLFSRVGVHMCFEVGTLSERFLADVALVIHRPSDSRVNSHVGVQRSLRIILFTAVLTLELFLAGVC